jgi:type I restriction enzyme S subunit
MVRQATGASYPAVSDRIISESRLPVPGLTVQRRIAAILDQVDTLRRKRQDALNLLDQLQVTIFNGRFVQNESDDWPLVRVADIAADARTGPFGSQLLHSEFVDEGIPVLGIDNAVNNEFRWDERRYITPEKYRQLRRYTVKPGDVLITLMGTCGRCAVVPKDIPTAINTKHLCCITLNSAKALPEFLHAAFLQHPSVLKQLGVQAKGAVMPGLNMGIIKSLELRIPPLDLQLSFVQRVEALNEVRASCREHSERLESLFNSLQHRAFNGELTSRRLAERELEMAG